MGSFFSKSKAFNPEIDISSLAGKVYLVTGANSGIGFQTARHLLRKGATVYLATRDESKFTGAIARLEADGSLSQGGQAKWLKLDLSSPKATRAAAEEFKRREERLDVLVNNAAIGIMPNELTEDGIIDSMATNHLGPFVLTMTLLPLLTRTAKDTGADVRIVNVTSNRHTGAPKNVRFDNIEAWNNRYEDAFVPGYARYGTSKLANILFTKELQNRLNGDQIPIVAMAVHPGSVFTEGSTALLRKSFLLRLLVPLQRLRALTPIQGSFTSLFAAASPIVHEQPDKYKGAYIVPFGQVALPSQNAQSKKLAEELWETSQKIMDGL